MDNDTSGATNCTGCGQEVYVADARGRCADCSSVCQYCSQTQHDSGMPVEVIGHKSGILMAHRICHTRAHAS